MTESTTPDAARRRGGPLAAGILVAALGGYGLWVASGWDDQGGDAPRASLACAGFAAERLGVPASAAFAPYPRQTVTGGPTRFEVRSSLAGADGAPATAFTCTLGTTDGQDWTLLALDVED